jgi:hypothetical protein
MSPTRRTGTALLAAISVAALAAVLASAAPAAATATATKLGNTGSTGTGQVFMVNPVQSSGDESLTDQKDSATAVPQSDYATMQLRNLDGSGFLTSKWVNVRSNTGPWCLHRSLPASRRLCTFPRSGRRRPELRGSAAGLAGHGRATRGKVPRFVKWYADPRTTLGDAARVRR